MTTGLFLTQLLCALVPCDFTFKQPEIANVEIDGRAGRLVPNVQDEELQIVQTNAGAVEGYLMKSSQGRTIYAFEGIPYAEPPVRFQPPIPKLPWSGLRSAKSRGPACLQLSPPKLYRTFGSEDCLTVNVYSTKLPDESSSRSSLLPVLLWIHGGCYAFGEGGEYGPSYFLNKEVVFVSFNYRLGILGFLSTGDDVVPGNNGLKDQSLAIKWVHDNIAQFGGDPNRVTLIGHAAGGSAAHIHMMSNKTSAHFRSAISISGTAMNEWAVISAKKSRKFLNRMAKVMRCPTLNERFQTRADSSRLVDCLKRKNANTLVSRQLRLTVWGPFPLFTFAPVLEKPSPSAVLTEWPKDIYARGGVAKMPWIVSYTRHEGLLQLLLVYALFKIPEFKAQWTGIAPYTFDLEDVPDSIKISNKIQKFYYGDESLKSLSYARLSEPITDRFFVNGIHKAIEQHAKIAPTYGYFFDFLGKYNVGNYLGLSAKEWGIGHAEDIFYMLNSSGTYNGFGQHDKSELAMSELMINLMTNFVTKNEPLYTDEDSQNREDKLIWTPLNSSTHNFLRLGNKVEMISEPFRERRQFWESLAIQDNLS